MDQINLTLAIEGMHCGACVRRVTAALEKIDGVEVVQVEIGSAQVRCAGSEPDVAQILEAVERIGFKAARA